MPPLVEQPPVRRSWTSDRPELTRYRDAGRFTALVSDRAHLSRILSCL
jgi:hypothetical protein